MASINIKFMITNSWTQFMSKDVPIYVHHMQPRFGQEIRNNLLSPMCHVYSLYSNPRESIYERVHVVLWLLFCKNMCLESISVLHKKLFKKHSSFQQNRQQYNAHKRTHPKQHLNPKVHIFHYVFAKKSYLIRAI